MQSGMITSTADTASSTSATGSTGKQTLGQDAFLQLLVSELKNQDPTQAQDPNAMIAQMAQFSALEQQTNTIIAAEAKAAVAAIVAAASLPSVRGNAVCAEWLARAIGNLAGREANKRSCVTGGGGRRARGAVQGS